jgi:hypothetical protein
MHCDCCDKILTDYEATLCYVSTGDFVNTCLKCLDGLNIQVKGNNRLKKRNEDYTEEENEITDPELKELVRQQRLDRDWEQDS